MTANVNWNDMTSSDDEDSWFDDDQPQEKKKVQPQTIANNENKNVTPLPSQQNKDKVQVRPVETKEKPPVQRQGNEKKHTFLKDQDLLIEYTNKKVDDPRVIKAVKVTNEQHKQLLKSLKNARVKQVRQGVFILNFYDPEGVLQFIKQKIANRYRFFLQQFFKRKLQNQQQAKQGEQRPQRQKKQRRRRYQQDREQELKQPQRQTNKQYKESKKQRQQQKAKKVYVAKETFQIENHKNVLIIKSQGFQVQRVIEELQDKKIFKDFTKLKIKTPYSFIAKVNKLVSEIGSKYAFILQKEPAEDTNKQEVVELTLVENKNKNIVKTKPVHIEKPKQQEKRYKQQDKTKVIKDQPKVEQTPARKLAANYDEYFANISKSNNSEIVKGFNQDQFVRKLKEFHTAIFQKSWNSWKIQGQQQQIQQLLKLVHRLKKSTIYDVDLKPGSRNQKAVLTAQLKPRPQKQRRPKVDVSGVNNYLS